MKRRWLITVMVGLALSIVQAHEFWLQPKKFRYTVGEEMKIDFMVGENFTGEFWDLKRHTVEKAEVFVNGASKNVLKDVKSTAGNNLTYMFDKPGTHLISLESNAAFIELEAEKFNAYLQEDGLDEILDARTNSKTLDKPSKEFYKRFAKLLVQSGTALDESYRRRLGFRYEIIPLTNPYSLKVGDYLECRVLWEGKVAAHSLVKVWSHISGRIFLQNMYTENDGTIKFPISSSGPWMVSSVKMISSELTGADYQSFWTSLVFGIDAK
ncbi:MAG TPA: DUF4198 domain-containing protein [Cyclobacteriaceae bacterium]|nr:DUF4198 domain-containing protein [Cyclobacteriaceae bacterium]